MGDDDPDPSTAYYRSIGLRASIERIEKIIEEYVTDGIIDWADCEFEEIDPASLEEDIRSCIQPISGEGIWYESGRILYSEEKPDNPESNN